MPRFYACPKSFATVENRASYEVETAEAYGGVWDGKDLGKQVSYRVLGEEVSDAAANLWTDPAPNGIASLLNRGRPVTELFGGNHAGGFHVVYLDGHVRFVSASADPTALMDAIRGIKDGDPPSE